jgi:hypothetical protein
LTAPDGGVRHAHRVGKGKRVRAARPRKLARRRDGFGEVWSVVADYKQLPTGGWVATVTRVDDGRSVGGGEAARGKDAHEAFHAVMDSLEAVTEHTGIGFATIHQLDGSTSEWAMLAAREDFIDCANGGLSRGALFFDHDH